MAACETIAATDAQVAYEWHWLCSKLQARSPAVYRRHRGVAEPAVHPLFHVVRGPVAEWEIARQHAAR